MSLILSDKDGPLMKSALAYIDDVLYFSGSVADHLGHLREIFQRFRDSKVKLNPSKCNFLMPKILFLGNIISAEGVGPDPDKIKTMLEYPVPTNQKKLKTALGLFQFYKKFIPSYSQMVVPLNKLMAKNDPIRWTERKSHAFHALRYGLKNAPFMRYPNDVGTFIVEPDSSKFAPGYLILQETPSGVNGIVSCGGRALRGAELSITELEMLSVIEAVIQ